MNGNPAPGTEPPKNETAKPGKDFRHIKVEVSK